MKYINQLQEEVKKLKKDKRELKKEVKMLKLKNEVLGMYVDSTEGWVPGEFYFPVLEKLNSCKKYSRAVTAAWVMQTIGIIIFYMVV